MTDVDQQHRSIPTGAECVEDTTLQRETRFRDYVIQKCDGHLMPLIAEIHDESSKRATGPHPPIDAETNQEGKVTVNLTLQEEPYDKVKHNEDENNRYPDIGNDDYEAEDVR